MEQLLKEKNPELAKRLGDLDKPDILTALKGPIVLNAPRSRTPADQRTIAEWLPNVPDDSMIHLTPEDPSAFGTGVKPESFWVRFGNVKHLTIGEYKRDVVLPFAAAHSREARYFVVKFAPDPNVIKPAELGAHEGEFQNNKTVMPELIIAVDALPAAPGPAKWPPGGK